ncbi:hypothetical protein [Lichenibacterium ramalinae]|uniref:Uncharacterized protein n=1 Tax=Lichenibacterium ramalinae TaxID=2316527 RepID=A0A4Q2RET3_9HYPH|nr:hypothetical protein [Lichenibacterium ramalinae]RYB06450.1 hypothetical protein D3272_06820 [Lichenibacterium ramalinae]
MQPRTADRAARDAESLVAVIDAQRAEQRNAESLLSRLWEARDALRARGSEEARTRLEGLDRDIAAVAARVKQALKLQGELTMQLGQGRSDRGVSAG